VTSVLESRSGMGKENMMIEEVRDVRRDKRRHGSISSFVLVVMFPS
jgi:hypothetical protein